MNSHVPSPNLNFFLCGTSIIMIPFQYPSRRAMKTEISQVSEICISVQEKILGIVLKQCLWLFCARHPEWCSVEWLGIIWKENVWRLRSVIPVCDLSLSFLSSCWTPDLSNTVGLRNTYKLRWNWGSSLWPFTRTWRSSPGAASLRLLPGPSKPLESELAGCRKLDPVLTCLLPRQVKKEGGDRTSGKAVASCWAEMNEK